jgi:hypothetical protein
MHKPSRATRVIVFALALVSYGTVAPAQQPATAPATRPGADAGVPAVVVTAVEGKARARTSADSAWEPVAEGMRLPVGAEITTGPRARVTCSIPPGEEFVVDRMSNVTVLEAERRGNRQQTRLIMEYGRTAARVQAAGIEHDMRIQTPATTASVKGTEYTVYDQPPFAPELRTYTGLVDYRFAKRQLLVGKGARSRDGRASAETALLASVVDPTSAKARTQADAALIANQTSRGAVVNYNPTIQLTEVRGGAGPQTDAALANSLPGRLNFSLRWSGNADIDLFVTVQGGDPIDIILGGKFNPVTFLYPWFGLQTSPTGGRIPFNHRGGPNGGQEICFWPDQFPTGVYGFSASNNSSTDSADVRFNAFLGGEKISLFGFADDGITLVRSKGLRRNVPPNGAQSTIVLAPPSPLFEDPTIFPESPDETLDGTLPQASAPPPEAPPVKQTKQSVRAAARAAAKAAKASKPAREAKPQRPPRSAFVATAPAARKR